MCVFPYPNVTSLIRYCGYCLQKTIRNTKEILGLTRQTHGTNTNGEHRLVGRGGQSILLQPAGEQGRASGQGGSATGFRRRGTGNRPRAHPSRPDASGGRSVNSLSATWGSYGVSHTYTNRDSVAGGERDLEMAEFRVRHVPARVRTGFRESASANAAAEDCFSFGVRGSRPRIRAGTRGDLCAACPPC